MTATQYINRNIAELCSAQGIEPVELSPDGEKVLSAILKTNSCGRIGNCFDDVNVFIGSMGGICLRVYKLRKWLDLKTYNL